MIIDTLEECRKYEAINPRFKDAFDFIRRAVAENLPVGKYAINGTELFASVQEYDTKVEEKCRYEAHRKYIDIQFIVSGTEVMKLLDPIGAIATTEYREDVQFFESTAMLAEGIISDGKYAIFFPSDIHKPGICDGKPSPVKKIVVKVAV